MTRDLNSVPSDPTFVPLKKCNVNVFYLNANNNNNIDESDRILSPLAQKLDAAVR